MALVCKEYDITEDPRYKELDEIIAQHRGQKSALIQVLYKAQRLFGCLPEPVQLKIARGLGLPMSHVFGVATFYAFFSLRPVGRHRIQVCLGTGCYVKGAAKLVERFQEELRVEVGDTTPDGLFSLEVARCFGCCALAPAVMVDGEAFAKVTPDDIPGIIEKYSGVPQPAAKAADSEAPAGRIVVPTPGVAPVWD